MRCQHIHVTLVLKCYVFMFGSSISQFENKCIASDASFPLGSVLVELVAFLPEVFELASHSLSHVWWLLPHSSDNQTLIIEKVNNWSIEEVVMWPKTPKPQLLLVIIFLITIYAILNPCSLVIF